VVQDMTGLEIAGALFAGLSGIVSAAGAMQQAQAQADAAEYQAEVARRNAKLARDQAEVEQNDQRRENRRQMGAMIAAYGASGVDMAGSPLDVLADTAIEQELDVARAGYRGELRAIGENDKANLAKAEASNARSAGAFSAVGALFKAGSSLLSTPTVRTRLTAS
jgi:hypothetical protein